MIREEILKIAKPILFNTDMVRAIPDGRKTATRRIVKGLDGLNVYMAEPTEHSLESGDLNEWEFAYGFYDSHSFYDSYKEVKCPYKVGDYLYVRETFGIAGFDYEECAVYIEYKAGDERKESYLGPGINYTEVILPEDKFERLYDSYTASEPDWRSPVSMPKEAARIFLKVTDVRVERMQDITEEQAEKEGCIDNYGFIHSPDNEYSSIHTAREQFINIWNSTIPKKDLDKYGWEANPWVWVIQFERVGVEDEV